MGPLAVNLFIIFGTRLTVTNFLDIFLPYRNTKAKQKAETEGVEDLSLLTPVEEDYMLCEYDTIIEGIKNYADLAIQYGFSMLFITALPIASFLSLFSNYVKGKFIIWKLFTLYQRPIPTGAQDIGLWQGIFQFVTAMSVVTNAGLVCFTMNVLPSSYTVQSKVWIFLGFQWIMFTFQFATALIVPDTPYPVEIQKERME